MINMKRVYVAGSITPKGIQEQNLAVEFLNNISKLNQAAVKIIKAGYAPYSPGIDFQYFLSPGGDTITEQEIKDISIAWLSVSDALLILPGYENSPGTLKEIKIAKELNIFICYNINDVINYLNKKE
jgi:hypothetical protein